MNVPGKENPGATLAAATGQENCGALCNFLRLIQRPTCAWSLCWAIEKWCARIETERELYKWNRER